jgi:small GTP-binding protein
MSGILNGDEYDMLFKILIIGDSGTGKSNLLLRYVKDKFIPDMKSTIGVEFGSKYLTIDNIKVKAQLWDTAGQERYRAITSAYYKGAKGVLIVYDITSKNSFLNIDKWLSDFKMKCDEAASIVLVGNKSDLEEKREVKKEEAEEKAQENNVAIFETSAKDNINVSLAFESLIKEIVTKVNTSIDDNFKNKNEINQKGKDKYKELNTKNVFNDPGQNIRLDMNVNQDNHSDDEISVKKNDWCCGN